MIDAQLTEDFHQSLLLPPVPMDAEWPTGVAEALLVDLYVWVTDRSRTLRQPDHFDWVERQDRFGASSMSVGEFRKMFAGAFLRVESVCPEISAELSLERISLNPTVV